MKAFKPILNALICITFSSCLYTENSDLYTDTELNETDFTIGIASTTSAQITESPVSQINEAILLSTEIQAFIGIDWRIKYPEMINVYYKDRQVGTPWECQCSFVDIDSDDSYELIAKIGSYGDGGDLLFLYDYDSMGIQHIETINGGSTITDKFDDNSKIVCILSDEIISIYLDKETNKYCLLSCVKYSSGGVYGYTIYFNSQDKSGTYHSETIGSIYSETNNYTPPYNWCYTLGNINSPTTSKENSEEQLLQYMQPYTPVHTAPMIESRLYSDIFLANTPIDDNDYIMKISLLEKDIYGKYFSV